MCLERESERQRQRDRERTKSQEIERDTMHCIDLKKSRSATLLSVPTKTVGKEFKT